MRMNSLLKSSFHADIPGKAPAAALTNAPPKFTGKNQFFASYEAVV